MEGVSGPPIRAADRLRWEFRRLCALDGRRGSHAKEFGYENGSRASAFAVRHVTPSAGDAWKPAYSTRIAVCGDTWQDAADAYRNGAQSLPWSKATFRERKDMPELQRAPPLCISSQLDREDLDTPPDRLSAWGRRFNAPIVYRPLGWEKHGNWTGIDYFPSSIGEQSFQQLATRLKYTRKRRRPPKVAK